MDLTITKTSYTQDPEWLMSDHKVHRPGGVTIDADAVAAVDGKKIVKAGTPIGKDAETGLYEPYVAAVTTPAVASSLTLGTEADNNGMVLTAVTAGEDGDDISYAVTVTEGPNVALDVSVADKAITVRPATSAAAAKSTATSGAESDNNGLTWTAKAYGKDGDRIIVILEDPGEDSQALGITVNGTVIIISLATGVGGTITTTADEIIAAITVSSNPAYKAEAAALVTVGDTGDSTGAAAVVDEVVQLANGADTVISSTVADVLEALAADDEAKALVSVKAIGESTGAALVTALDATNLAGGANAVTVEANVTPTELLFNTVDCTSGDQAAGSLIHGYVNEDRLPVPIDAVCKANMPQIAFLKY